MSAVTHAALFLLILFITTRMPAPSSSQRAAPASNGIVWIPRPGPAGGGGGGGNRTPEPPGRAEARGVDRVSAPRPRRTLEPTPAAVTAPQPIVEIDALPTASGITEMPGVMAATPATSTSLGPGDGSGAGDGRRGGVGSGDGTGLGPGQDRGSGGGPYQPGSNGVSYPRLIREVAPMYSNGALQARVQGIVELQAVVRADGSVGDVWITRSLDRSFGLDQEAIRTVRLWRFVPAMLAGRPVDAVVPIEMQFTIR